MKTFLKPILIFLIAASFSISFGQSYENHIEFPETMTNFVTKLIARCPLTDNIASAGAPFEEDIVFAGETIMQWQACVLVSDSMGNEEFAVQFTTNTSNYATIKGINYAPNGDLLILLEFWNSITIEGVQYNSMGDIDMLVITYNSSGIHESTHHIGDTENIILSDIDVAPNGEYRLVGIFSDSLYVNGIFTGVSTISDQGYRDFILLTLNSSGYSWCKTLGKSGHWDTDGYSIDVDENGDNYCVLNFTGSNFNFGNGIEKTSHGSYDWAIAKFSNSGLCLDVFQIGGTSSEEELGYIEIINNVVFFHGKVSTVSSFYIDNADGTNYATFSTQPSGGGAASVFAWLDFSSGNVISGGRILAALDEVWPFSMVNDSAYLVVVSTGNTLCNDVFGGGTVSLLDGIHLLKIDQNSHAIDVHNYGIPSFPPGQQYYYEKYLCGTISNRVANRIYVGMRGADGLDLDPGSGTVTLASNKRGVVKYNCNPVVGPTAGFSGTPLNGDTPLNVSFTDLSVAGTNAITIWSWDFGDGGSSSSQNPSHTYNTPGTYTVSLTVSDGNLSDEEVKTDYITVTQPTPVADFSGTPLSGDAPLNVNFTDLSINNPESWTWDFGDGESSTNQNPNHTYNMPGTYTVSLTVSNSGGSDTETKTDYIIVSAVPPTANFSGSPTTGVVPLEVSFTDQSTAGTYAITSWEWDFGDGNTSSIQNPNHTYNSPGDFTVSLTVSDGTMEDTETKTNYISVSPVGAPIANFSASPIWGSGTLSTQFTDESVPGSYPIASWSWDFGDGGSSSSQNPTYTYSNPGTYTVSLTVSDGDLSDTETKVDYIHVYELLSVNAGSDQALEVGLSTQLDGSYSGGSGNVEISWEGVENTIPISNPNILNPSVGPFLDIDAYYFSLSVEDLITGEAQSDEMMVDVLLGLEEDLSSKIAVYPNPTNGKLWIDTEEPIESIKINDALGSEINQLRPTEKTTEIDLGSYPNGVYLVQVLTKDGLITFKVVKK